VIVCRWGRVFRRHASACAVGGTPRPERPTMTPVFVRPVGHGDGEGGVSMPGRPAEVSPGAQAVAYATDPDRCGRRASDRSLRVAGVAAGPGTKDCAANGVRAVRLIIHKGGQNRYGEEKVVRSDRKLAELRPERRAAQGRAPGGLGLG
jgi:hypothetical protein